MPSSTDFVTGVIKTFLYIYFVPVYLAMFLFFALHWQNSLHAAIHILDGEKTYCGRSFDKGMERQEAPEKATSFCMVCARKFPGDIQNLAKEKTPRKTKNPEKAKLFCCFPSWMKKKLKIGEKRVYHIKDSKEEGVTLCHITIRTGSATASHLPHEGVTCLSCLHREGEDIFNSELTSALK